MSTVPTAAERKPEAPTRSDIGDVVARTDLVAPQAPDLRVASRLATDAEHKRASRCGSRRRPRRPGRVTLFAAARPKDWT